MGSSKRGKKKTKRNFRFGDHVRVSLNSMDVPGGPMGDFKGIVVYNHAPCEGCAVYLPSKNRHIFITQEQMQREAWSMKDFHPTHVEQRPWLEKRVVDIHPLNTPYAESFQTVKILAQFPLTGENLVQLWDFDQADWWGSYVVVKNDRLGEIPTKAPKFEWGEEVCFRHPKKRGFWKGTLVGWLGSKMAVRQHTPNDKDQIVAIWPCQIFEKIKFCEK